MRQLLTGSHASASASASAPLSHTDQKQMQPARANPGPARLQDTGDTWIFCILHCILPHWQGIHLDGEQLHDLGLQSDVLLAWLNMTSGRSGLFFLGCAKPGVPTWDSNASLLTVKAQQACNTLWVCLLIGSALMIYKQQIAKSRYTISQVLHSSWVRQPNQPSEWKVLAQHMSLQHHYHPCCSSRPCAAGSWQS